MSTKNCPLCGQPPSPDHAPFCSRGCKDRDLLRWLDQGYRIAGPPADAGLDGGGLDSEGSHR
ncbi:DNA gyrase inhibitor YacG [Sphingomonas sp. ASV193]|uniref:DNA gyrase inhibitor YacG n=1 Tax=Sphingomonas sp. ASV193 TaxID=3144405 RepID=UPI0032E88AC7